MFDLISIGDVVIDTFVMLDDGQIFEQDGISFLGLKYGQKIPIRSSISTVGGNAANNAVGSARLNLKTAIYTNVGNKDDDRADDRIKHKLKQEGVDIRFIAEDPNLETSHHIVLDFKGERTILTFHQDFKYNLPDLDKTKWVYLTSLSVSYINSNLVEQIINYVQRVGCKLAFQPGTYQVQQGLRENAKVLSLAEVLVLNKEEAKTLLGFEDKSVPIKKMLQRLVDHGPKNVVITDGSNGSYSFNGEKFFEIGSFPAKLVEMTGAGDAYATSLVAALIDGEELKEAMRWGACNSAAVVEQIGAQAGLLTYNQMQEKLKEHSKIVAKAL